MPGLNAVARQGTVQKHQQRNPQEVLLCWNQSHIQEKTGKILLLVKNICSHPELQRRVKTPQHPEEQACGRKPAQVKRDRKMKMGRKAAGKDAFSRGLQGAAVTLASRRWWTSPHHRSFEAAGFQAKARCVPGTAAWAEAV